MTTKKSFKRSNPTLDFIGSASEEKTAQPPKKAKASSLGISTNEAISEALKAYTEA